MNPRVRRFVNSVAAVGLACVCNPAWAQNAAPAPVAQGADTQHLVHDLDALALQTRLDAQNRLANDPAISLRQLEGALKQADLSAEQRERLLAAAYKHFCTEPRGAMGVGPGAVFEQGHGATLQQVNANFPAASVLKPGDRVITADGQPVEDFNSLRPVILSHDPGDELPLTIVRGGATLNVTVKLASYADLLQTQGPGRPQSEKPDQSLLQPAWALRTKPLRDAAAGSGAPIPCPGLTAANWTQASYDEAELLRGRVVDPDPTRTSVVAGGEARGGTQTTAALSDQVRAAGARQFPADGRIRIVQPQPQGAEAARLQLALQLQVLQAMRQDLETQISELNRKLADPGTPEASKATLRGQVDLRSRELKVNDDQTRLITNQLNNINVK